MRIELGINKWERAMQALEYVKEGIQEPPKVVKPPFLDTSTRVTISEAARRALADEQAREAKRLDRLVPLHLKMF